MRYYALYISDIDTLQYIYALVSVHHPVCTWVLRLTLMMMWGSDVHLFLNGLEANQLELVGLFKFIQAQVDNNLTRNKK